MWCWCLLLSLLFFVLMSLWIDKNISILFWILVCKQYKEIHIHMLWGYVYPLGAFIAQSVEHSAVIYVYFHL